MQRTSLTFDEKTSRQLGKIAKKDNRSKIGEIRFLISEREKEITSKPGDFCKNCEVKAQ